MNYNFFKKIILSFVVIVLCSSSVAFALSKPEVENFMAQISAIINRRNMYEITNFFKFNSSPDAKFIKSSSLYNNTDPNKVIGSEELNMTVSEYIEYLKGILIPPTKYGYYATIDDIVINGNTALVTMHINELSSKTTYNINSTEQQTLVAANCNYTIGNQNSQLTILGMNCIEKIIKKTVSLK